MPTPSPRSRPLTRQLATAGDTGASSTAPARPARVTSASLPSPAVHSSRRGSRDVAILHLLTKRWADSGVKCSIATG
jgi:hypothetical protein